MKQRNYVAKHMRINKPSIQRSKRRLLLSNTLDREQEENLYNLVVGIGNEHIEREQDEGV